MTEVENKGIVVLQFKFKKEKKNGMKQLLILATEENSFWWEKDEEASEAGCVFCARLNLSITNVLVGLAFVILILRHPSAITIRKLWKN